MERKIERRREGEIERKRERETGDKYSSFSMYNTVHRMYSGTAAPLEMLTFPIQVS